MDDLILAGESLTNHGEDGSDAEEPTTSCNGKGQNHCHDHDDVELDMDQQDNKNKRKNVKGQDQMKKVKGDGDGDGAEEPYDWEEEHRHYMKIMIAYDNYKDYYSRKMIKSLEYIKSLPVRHQDLLYEYTRHLELIKTRCIVQNQEILSLICPRDSNIFVNHSLNTESISPIEPKPSDYDKLQSVLKQIVRDWSSEGEKERDACYRPIIEEIERQFPIVNKTNGDVKILFPGAGLCRLAHEVVRRGYIVEGNEFSLFMLFASNFILNKCKGSGNHTFYPFIHQVTNVGHSKDQIRPVQFPDIDPSDIPQGTRFSMSAGDFLDVYSTRENREVWDCLVACFFIDCSKNVVQTFEVIYHCLKYDGVFINLGPLLYHYADLPEDNSLEPSLDFILEILKNIGFTIEKVDKIESQYCENSASMLKYTYECNYLVCRKKRLTTDTDTADQNILIESKSNLELDEKDDDKVLPNTQEL